MDRRGDWHKFSCSCPLYNINMRFHTNTYEHEHKLSNLVAMFNASPAQPERLVKSRVSGQCRCYRLVIIFVEERRVLHATHALCA